MIYRMIENDDTPSPLTQLAVEPSIDPLQDFLFNTPRITIQGLKDSQQVYHNHHFITTSFFKISTYYCLSTNIQF